MELAVIFAELSPNRPSLCKVETPRVHYAVPILAAIAVLLRQPWSRTSLGTAFNH